MQAAEITAKYLWDDHKGVLQLGSLGVLAPLGALLTQNKFIFSVHLLEIYTARQYTDLQHSRWNFSSHSLRSGNSQLIANNYTLGTHVRAT